MANRSWQRQERLVADWFKTRRNPLSGSNNVDDFGRHRIGDIIIGCGVVEVKRRSTVSMRTAQETRRRAQAVGRPWAVFEFQTGTADLVKITIDHETARDICAIIRKRWEARACVPADGLR